MMTCVTFVGTEMVNLCSMQGAGPIVLAVLADPFSFMWPKVKAPTHFWHGAGTKAGLIKTAVFANGTAGARYVGSNGKWLAVPDAALIGTAKNGGADQDTAVLLTLSNPAYDAATQVGASPSIPCCAYCSYQHLFRAQPLASDQSGQNQVPKTPVQEFIPPPLRAGWMVHYLGPCPGQGSTPYHVQVPRTCNACIAH